MLTTEQAAAMLGVSRQTLYAYASRGLLRPSADPGAPRRSLYDPHEVKRLAEHHGRGRSRAAAAADAMNFGEPVLTSRITRIQDGRLWYRGIDAVALAETATLEEASALLWECDRALETHSPSGQAAATPRPSLMQRCIEAVASRAGVGAWTARPAAIQPIAAELLLALGEAAAGAAARTEQRPLHEHLSLTWTSQLGAADAIRRALVLSADHELNASTYAVRVVASTRAPLGACVLAGLAALSGPLHGGATARVSAMMADRTVMASPEAAIGARLARGEIIPGFGHRLYPQGDPRAAAILSNLTLPPHWSRVMHATEGEIGKRPNIDFALAALEHVHRLPEGAAFAIFATGRCAGWIAHALEQWAEGRLIRPRAAYAGR